MSNEVKTLILRLRKGYQCGSTLVIVQTINEIIELLLDREEGYPKHVREGLLLNVDKMRELRDVISHHPDTVDYAVEWKKFNVVADDITHSVFIPWLNESNDVPFQWVKGGDA